MMSLGVGVCDGSVDRVRVADGAGEHQDVARLDGKAVDGHGGVLAAARGPDRNRAQVGASASPFGAQPQHRVRPAEQRLGDVAHRHAAQRLTGAGPAVGVAVHGEVGAAGVDRLGEQVAAEERVDLQPLARRASPRSASSGSSRCARRCPGRVRAPHSAVGHRPGVARRTPSSAARRTPSSWRPGSRRRTRACRRRRRARRRPTNVVASPSSTVAPAALDDGAHLVGGVALVVVVAEHGDHRHRQLAPARRPAPRPRPACRGG